MIAKVFSALLTIVVGWAILKNDLPFNEFLILMGIQAILLFLWEILDEMRK